MLAALLLASTGLPALAQSIGDPGNPETWRTPEFKAQWGLHDTRADFAYARGFDGSGIKVGVVDSGLDVGHPEFQGRYDPGLPFNPAMPWDIDKSWHGTMVSSVIAANRDGKGMHGVAPGATIVAINVDAGDGYFDAAATLYGIRTLVGQGVRIINNSYGFPVLIDSGQWGDDWERPELDGASSLDIYREALEADALLIWGTGNSAAPGPMGESGLPYLYPELEKGWLAVTAVGPGYMPFWPNSCGVAMNWCLAAPGGGNGLPEEDINVAIPGGGYSREFGTSLSTPFVTGAAALVAQAFPYMTMSQVRQVLLGTARDIGDPGVDPLFGYGLLDVGKAVRGPGKFDWGDFVANVPSGRSIWENDITGDGGLVKTGDGFLILTGNSSYRGDTRIAQGVLGVNGSIASQTFIEPEGVLAGIGIIHGDVYNDGAVYGGFSSLGGTLTIDGNYTQSVDAALMIMVGAPNGTSRVNVTGVATVDGWADIMVPPGGYRGDARYTVLEALGGLAIDRSAVDDCGCYAFLDIRLSYDPNSVYLNVARNTVTFAALAGSRNSAAAAGGVERLGIGNPLYDLAVVQPDGDAAAALFGQLPGDLHGSTVTGLIGNSQLIGTQMNDRLRTAFETVGTVPLMAYGDDATITTAALAPAARYGAWGSAFGSWGSTDSDDGSLSRSTGGFVTGIDGFVSDDWRLGFLAGYSHSSFKQRKSSASSENYHFGVYGGTQWGVLSLRSGLAYTWSDIDSSRQIWFPGFADGLSGSYRAGTTQVFGELGYGIKAGNIGFEPFANLAYVNVHSNGFTEKGGAAALTVHNGSNAVTFTTLGVRASTDFDFGTMKATARGMLGWRHGFGAVTPAVTQAFADSNAFAVAGAPVARDSAVIEAGLDFAIAAKATLGLSYQGQVGSGARDHGVRADLSVKF